MWEVKCVDFFRYFRILQTGKNQRGAYELCVCCMELYGLLCLLSPESAKRQQQQHQQQQQLLCGGRKESGSAAM